jgi:hypothetical protein
MRQLADLRRRMGAAEGALTDALATLKRAEEGFDAASDRFNAAERALDEAREDRAQARRDRYAARQAYERASAAADRLARRVRETSERLDRAAELAVTLQPRQGGPITTIRQRIAASPPSVGSLAWSPLPGAPPGPSQGRQRDRIATRSIAAHPVGCVRHGVGVRQCHRAGRCSLATARPRMFARLDGSCRAAGAEHPAGGERYPYGGGEHPER